MFIFHGSEEETTDILIISHPSEVVCNSFDFSKKKNKWNLSF